MNFPYVSINVLTYFYNTFTHCIIIIQTACNLTRQGRKYTVPISNKVSLAWHTHIQRLPCNRITIYIFGTCFNCVENCVYCKYTLSGQKYLYTAKYPCTDCAIYRLKNQLGAKMGIEIHRYQQFIVLALP